MTYTPTPLPPLPKKKISVKKFMEKSAEEAEDFYYFYITFTFNMF